eukprot:COSAG02_NODE_333_length_24452_cov_12.756703_3_plen_227_part_00
MLVKPAASGVQVFDRSSGKMMIDHLFPYGALVSWEPSEHGFEIKTIDGKAVFFMTPSGAMLCDAISDRKSGNAAPSAPLAAAKASERKIVEKTEGDMDLAETAAAASGSNETVGQASLEKTAPPDDQDTEVFGPSSSADDGSADQVDMGADLDALAAELELADDPEDIDIAAALAAELAMDADEDAPGPDTLTDLDDMMAELKQGSDDDDGLPEMDDLDAMMAELG